MPRLLNFRKYKGSAVLVAQAHTDDADFYCGAAVCRLARGGAKVTYVTCTRGEKGTLDRALHPDELTGIRREEQRRANDILGVSDTVHFDYPDGELKPTSELQGKITALIRERRPSLILTFDPSWQEYRMHPDHRASAIAALRANAFSALPNYFPEHLDRGLEPYQCPEILLFNPPRRADVFAPVGGMFRKKIAALQAHESQMAHLLTPGEKRFAEVLRKIPIAFVSQAIAGVLARQFIVETFRRLPARALLR